MKVHVRSVGVVWLGAVIACAFVLPVSAQRQVRKTIERLQTAPAAPFAADITAPGDPIVGIASTPGSSTSTLAVAGGGSGNAYPTAEAPPNAINNNQGDKYLNFQQSNAGFIVSPSTGRTFLSGFRFSTGNDAPERDPATITIEGTNSLNATTTLNSTWTLIYSGVSGLATDPGRNTFGSQVNFTTVPAYRSYRVLITAVRTPASANSFQFGEIELIGNVATAANVSVSGRVVTNEGIGLRNARVTITDPDGNTVSTITNAFGRYTFPTVRSGAGFVVNAAAKGYRFTSQFVQVSDTVTGLDIIASP